jgi:hypothetical protein
LARVEAVDRRQLVIGELDLEHIDVLCNSLRAGRLRDPDGAHRAVGKECLQCRAGLQGLLELRGRAWCRSSRSTCSTPSLVPGRRGDPEPSDIALASFGRPISED